MKTKRVDYGGEGEQLSVLVHLVDKMRRSEIMLKLFGGATFPYNTECQESLKITEQRGVEMLVASGETKAEFQRVLAAYFVSASTDGGGVKKRVQPSCSSEEDEPRK